MVLIETGVAPGRLHAGAGGSHAEPVMTGERKVIMASRKVADCRRFPSEKGCTVTISGTESEVLDLAVQHAVSSHGHQDTPELREQIRGMLEDEK